MTLTTELQALQKKTSVMPLEWLIAGDKEITQSDLDAINNNPHGYDNRERIPEPLLVYSDLYHDLTGQEMLKMDVTGYIEVFQEWKDRALQPDDIRGAWAQSKSDKGGFFVGHPRALTITANGMKSKAKPAVSVLNKSEVERTNKLIEKKVEMAAAFVPMPDDVRARIKAKLAEKRNVK